MSETWKSSSLQESDPGNGRCSYNNLKSSILSLGAWIKFSDVSFYSVPVETLRNQDYIIVVIESNVYKGRVFILQVPCTYLLCLPLLYVTTQRIHVPM